MVSTKGGGVPCGAYRAAVLRWRRAMVADAFPIDGVAWRSGGINRRKVGAEADLQGRKVLCLSRRGPLRQRSRSRQISGPGFVLIARLAAR